VGLAVVVPTQSVFAVPSLTHASALSVSLIVRLAIATLLWSVQLAARKKAGGSTATIVRV
jgi:hypothetical protein